MKYISLFENFISESERSTDFYYDESVDATRDKATGYFVNPENGEFFHSAVKAINIPKHMRKRWVQPTYTIKVPRKLEGFVSATEINYALSTNKIKSKDVNDFFQKLRILSFAKAIGRKPSDVSKMVNLFHGTVDKKAMIIKSEGFKLTKGTRADELFGGSNFEIDNQGIFLSDSYRLAKYYGQNRAGGSNLNYDVINVLADIRNIFDMTSAENCQEVSLVKKAYQRITNRNRVNVFVQDDIYRIVDDAQVVSVLMSLGYDSVKFKESKDSLHNADVPEALTYIVFEPHRLYFKPDEVHTSSIVNYVAEYIRTGVVI